MKAITGSMMIFALIGLSAPAFGGDKDPVANSTQYNVKTEVELKGTIQSVREVPAGEAFAGIHITFFAPKSNETVEVFVGPTDFLKFMDVKLKGGLKDVGLTGSKMKLAGKDLLLARELRIDTLIISLRDEKGFPNWLWMQHSGPSTGF
jgi:hypothetical protein